MSEFLGALAVSLVLSGVAVPLLRRAQFMDVPNHRSSHTKPVPRGGGVSVVLTIVAVAALAADLDVSVVGLLVITLALALVGLVDDLRSLSSGVRLLAQVGAATALSVLLLVQGSVTWFWLPVLVIAVAGYVNAYNFMDGVNGISALTAAVVGGFWAWAGTDQNVPELSVLGLVLAGAALGFLPWNAPRAKVFLGDVGSYGIGLFIVGLSAYALTQGLPWQWTLAPLVIYGADTGWVLVKRFRGGRSLTEAHREHVYQRLVDGGWSHLSSSVACAVAGALICLTVLAGGTTLTWWTPLVVLVVVLAYLNLPATLKSEVDA